jgi:hypothetical protein
MIRCVIDERFRSAQPQDAGARAASGAAQVASAKPGSILLCKDVTKD